MGAMEDNETVCVESKDEDGQEPVSLLLWSYDGSVRTSLFISSSLVLVIVLDRASRLFPLDVMLGCRALLLTSETVACNRLPSSMEELADCRMLTTGTEACNMLLSMIGLVD